MRIMGLDASTTTIGLAVLDFDTVAKPQLFHVEFFKPPKGGNIFERLDEVTQFIMLKLEEFEPDRVALEDIVLYMAGKSSARTITSLAVLNRTVGLTVLKTTEIPPELLSVLKIRHAIKLNKTLPKKEEIPNLVAQILEIDFPWQFNKKGKPKEENYDMADAVAVALAAGMPPKIKTPKSKKKQAAE